jgi:hypothetical protein
MPNQHCTPCDTSGKSEKTFFGSILTCLFKLLSESGYVRLALHSHFCKHIPTWMSVSASAFQATASGTEQGQGANLYLQRTPDLLGTDLKGPSAPVPGVK